MKLEEEECSSNFSSKFFNCIFLTPSGIVELLGPSAFWHFFDLKIFINDFPPNGDITLLQSISKAKSTTWWMNCERIISEVTDKRKLTVIHPLVNNLSARLRYVPLYFVTLYKM